MIKRFLITTLLMASVQLSFSQQKLIDKADKAIGENKYRSAIGYLEKASKHDATRNSTEVYYKMSQAWFYGFKKDVIFRKDNPKALKTAMKQLKKAMDKDKDNDFDVEFAPFRKTITTEWREKAVSEIYRKKYPKAISMLNESYKAYPDTITYMWYGRAKMLNGDNAAAEKILKKATTWNINDFNSIKNKESHFSMGFVWLADYYIKQRKYKEANDILVNALQMFEGDKKVLRSYKPIAYSNLHRIPPSYDYYNQVEKLLKLYPTDSLVLFRENAVNLFLLNTNVAKKEYEKANVLVENFIKRKKERAKSKDSTLYKNVDRFVFTKRREVYKSLIQYLFEYNLNPSAVYVMGKYAKHYGKKEDVVEADWINYINSIKKDYPIEVLSKMFNVGNETFKGTAIKELRKTIALEKNKEVLNYGDKQGLISLFKDASSDFNMDQGLKDQLKANILSFINSAIGKNDFDAAIYELRYYSKYFSNEEGIDGLWKRLSLADFDQNFYGSSMKMVSIGGRKKVEHLWNGGLAGCNPGSLSKDVSDKMEQRIAYFRRQSGVLRPVEFSKSLNQKCQDGALIMETKSTASHKVTKVDKCYTQSGAEAAVMSLIVKSEYQPLVFAVTSIMDDVNSSCGMRMGLLNPKAGKFGYGASKRYTLIWAMDFSAKKDSVKYEEDFIAWPNKGYIPTYLMFDKWSFSAHQNFEGATISMKDSKGANVSLKQMPVTKGYSIPTIVWVPSINRKTIVGDTFYDVTVSLSSGKTFSYRVNAVAHNPKK